jgi:hypothetical protein
MHRQPLDSTAIVSAGYDAASQQLEIEFRNGRVYRYLGVPQGVYDFLLRARSKGGFVNRMVDGHYAYEQLPSAHEEPEQDLLAALQASVSTRARKRD